MVFCCTQKFQAHVVSSSEECRSLIHQIRQQCVENSTPAVGFDCEWETPQSGLYVRGKVALLQLAAPGGMCVLLRLHLFRSMPQELSQFLGDQSILKVGVDTWTDAQNLRADYGLNVRGALDSRFLARHLNTPGNYGLAELASTVLSKTLNKDGRIAASKWGNPALSEEQIQYAALDAITGLEIVCEFSKKMQVGVMRQYQDRQFM